MINTFNTTITNEDIKQVNNIFDELEAVKTVSPEEAQRTTLISKYITSIASSGYAKSVEDIANTNMSNSLLRKKNFVQIMQQSFFIGANRYGNNFIA